MFYRAPTRKHTVETPFDVSGVDDLPRVDIVYSYVDADGLLVDAVRQNGSDGLIISGFGAGLAPPAVWEAGARAVKDGIPVVLASRATAGRVVMTPRMDELGFIVCDQPAAPEGEDTVEAGPLRHQGPEGDPADVLRILVLNQPRF